MHRGCIAQFAELEGDALGDALGIAVSQALGLNDGARVTHTPRRVGESVGTVGVEVGRGEGLRVGGGSGYLQ